MTNKTIKQILNSYSFPKLFYVKYAVAAAKYAISFVDKPTSETLTAIDLAERYSLGEHITTEALREAAAASNAAYSASNAAYSAVAASVSPLLTGYGYNAAYHTISASKDSAKAEADLHDLLLNLMNKEFNEFELLMMKLGDN